MEEQWKNKLQGKMADYQEPTPDALWDKIDAALGGQVQLSSLPRKEKKSSIVFWLSSIGTAAAVLALIFLTSNIPTSTTAPTSTLATTTSTSGHSEYSEIYEYSEASTATIAASSSPSGISDCSENSEYVKASTIDNTATATASSSSEVSECTENSESTKATPTAPSSKASTKLPAISSHKSGSRLSASIYASNLPGSSSSNSSIGGHTPFASLSPDGFNSEVFDPNDLNILLSQNRESKESTKATHRLPIKVGAAVRYDFNDRWSIETGVTYSHLSSHISSGSELYSKEIEQKLNFIGIPLKASFSIWKNQRWNIYASAGGMVEKCVSGTADIDNVLNGTVVSSENETVKMSQLQFSAGASAGVQVNILPNLGLYAEPGINYYFDNGSPIETIYSDKPLDFNLQFGIRVTFK